MKTFASKNTKRSIIRFGTKKTSRGLTSWKIIVGRRLIKYTSVEKASFQKYKDMEAWDKSVRPESTLWQCLRLTIPLWENE